MNLSNLLSDPLIKRFFFRAVVFFVILSAFLAGAWFAYGEVEKKLQAKERPKIQELNGLQSDVLFLQQQLRLYRQYGDKYEELLKQGLVEQLDRVFWIDSLIKLSGQYLIPSLKFSFSAEKPLTSALFANIEIPNRVFYYSRLKLDMSLQHEEDLIRVFEAISQNISPFYLVESCKTEMIDDNAYVEANFNLLKGNLITDCSLIVFSTHSTVQKAQIKQ
ncbi:hypothetical protein MNBD_GAMMA03-1182 [hydrothermal vent metagenome]|uniref:Uncharacterized protein n=1 Tax=hydrothermal vent metagenome TaxID=652676 RepID=A0A3B0WR42_9ZZZZ